MAIQIITHETLEARRDVLRNNDVEAHLALKVRRYALFRVQNFLGGGSIADPEHIEVAQALEKEVAEFGGIAEFACKWDIDPLTNRVVGRDRSVWQAHEEFMQRVAPAIGSREALAMASAISDKVN